MSGLKTSLAAIALLTVMGGAVRAQGVVPGGWSSQFGYQPLGGPTQVAGAGLGLGGGGMGGVGYGGLTPYPVGGGSIGFAPVNLPAATPMDPYGYGSAGRFGYGPGFGVSPGMPQTSHSADPLIGAISKSVRRARHR
jgi:hypothetical protein